MWKGEISMAEFSERLKGLIVESGMNQKEFADKSGLTPAAISRYVNGSRIPGMDTLLQLKSALGCEWEQLMGE